MLKKDELERELREANERSWGNDLADVAITRMTYTELVRLALIGLECENASARSAMESVSSLTDNAFEYVPVVSGASEAQWRDDRAEQIGKLVLELWGTDPKPIRWSADHRAALDRYDSAPDHFHTVRLMRGIADILDQT